MVQTSLFVERHSVLCSFENGPWYSYVLFVERHSVLCSFENGPWYRHGLFVERHSVRYYIFMVPIVVVCFKNLDQL